MRYLLAIAVIAGTFWWFAPQTAREKAVDIGSAGASRAMDLAAPYREPVWNWVKKVADLGYDKAMALFRSQLHRAVDESVK